MNRRAVFIALTALVLAGLLRPLPASAADTSAVRVGWFYQPGYQELDDEGNPRGYNYEYLLSLAEEAGWEMDFVTRDGDGNALTWEKSLAMLASGELDLMGCLLFSEERAEQFDYAELAAGQTFTSLFVRDDSPLTCNEFDALNNITVAASTATLNDEDLTAFSRISGFAVGGFLDCGDMQGVIDAVLNGTADAGVMASYQPVNRTRVIASFAPRPFYFATTKGNAEVLAALNQGMSAIQIQNPYYSQNLSEKYCQTYNGQAALSEAEQDFIARAKPIRVCCSDEWYPLYQAAGDPNGPTGVIPDVLKEISEKTGLTWEYVPVSTREEAYDAVSSGRCDVLGACVYDLQRVGGYRFILTNTYLQMRLVAVGRTGSIPKNVTIGTLADYPLYHTTIWEDEPSACQYFETPEACFESLRRGATDIIVLGAYTANYYLAQSRYTGFVRTSLTGEAVPVCMAVSEEYSDRKLLLSVLNKAVSGLSAEEVDGVILENTVRDSSGLEAALNRIPTTIVVFIGVFMLAVTIAVVLLSVSLMHKSADARKLAEEQKAEAERAAELLRIDELTGVYNARGFYEAARRQLDAFPDRRWFVLDFDVDGFKYVNELYGYERADEMLVGLTRITVEGLRPDEICGRIFGDHYACLLWGDDLSAIKERIRIANDQFRNLTDRYVIALSFGVYPVEDGSMTVSAMCDRAQIAKRKVKGRYESYVAVYDDKLDTQQRENLELVSHVERALADKEFQALYQPQYDMRSERIVSAEALVRWQRGAELICPDRFISVFEGNGLIGELDYYMVAEVCAHLRAQLAAGLDPVPISVNFSRSHLHDPTFLPKLFRIVSDYRVPANLLMAEFTEYTCLENEASFRTVISQLHKFGMLVALDDFGSGYSSLNMLKDMDFDVLKLDKGFLKESPLGPKSRRLIQTILQLARGLKIQTVAEGVETGDQLAFLRENGCDIAQGYYFSRPVCGEMYDAMLRERAESSGGQGN